MHGQLQATLQPFALCTKGNAAICRGGYEPQRSMHGTAVCIALRNFGCCCVALPKPRNFCNVKGWTKDAHLE